MPDLAAFQRRFAAQIARPPSAFEAQGLAVYRNTVAHGAVEALTRSFPVVRHILGAGTFGGVASDYAVEHPPSTPVLAAYGARFPDFLVERGWGSALPHLPDVARIDRMRTEAHLAADAAPFDPAPGSDWMALRLALHPATRFAMFATPALWIWSANAAPEARLRCSASDGVLVTRRGGAVACHAIGPAEALLLEHIGSGASVGAAALAVAARFAGTDISRLFARIIVSGALAAPPPQ